MRVRLSPGIATRATTARRRRRSARCTSGRLEVGGEDLPRSIEHHLPRGQDAVADEPADHVAGDVELSRGFEHRQTATVLHRGLVPRDAGFAAIASDTAPSSTCCPGRCVRPMTVERGRDVGVRPAGRHARGSVAPRPGRPLRVLPGRRACARGASECCPPRQWIDQHDLARGVVDVDDDLLDQRRARAAAWCACRSSARSTPPRDRPRGSAETRA